MDTLHCDNIYAYIPCENAMGRYELEGGQLVESYVVVAVTTFCLTRDEVLVAFISRQNDKLRILRYSRARNRYQGPITP